MEFKLDTPNEWQIVTRSDLLTSDPFTILGVDGPTLHDYFGFTNFEIESILKNLRSLTLESEMILAGNYVTTWGDVDTGEESLPAFSCQFSLSWLSLSEQQIASDNSLSVICAAILLGGSDDTFGSNPVINPEKLLFDPKILEIQDKNAVRIQWLEDISTTDQFSDDSVELKAIHDTYLVEAPEGAAGIAYLQFSTAMPWFHEQFYELTFAIAATLEIVPESERVDDETLL
jgi:hypothetical protein